MGRILHFNLTISESETSTGVNERGENGDARNLIQKNEYIQRSQTESIVFKWRIFLTFIAIRVRRFTSLCGKDYTTSTPLDLRH